jgi:transcription termination factor Rho
MTETSLRLSDLKAQSPKDLLAMAEELEIENASTMRKGDMMFEILRERADEGWEIAGDGVLEVSRTGSVSCAAPRRITCPVPTTSMFLRT